VAPIALGGAISVALFSYAGGLCFGFNSDWDKFPDLHDLVLATEQEFEKLRKAAVAEGPLPPEPRRRQRQPGGGPAPRRTS
jgi:hypothetical protein